MTDRREFLQYAMVSAVPLATGVALETKVAPRVAVPHVVIDSRHPESRTFGARFAGSGATVHALGDGDATDLWLHTLGPAWREAPVAVAGLTRPPALFILEQLAWSHGLRVVYHGEHVVSGAAPTAHQILRAPTSAVSAGQLQRLEAQWPRRLADWVAGFSPAAAAVRAGPTPAGLLPLLPVGGELLTSWIIAPA